MTGWDVLLAVTGLLWVASLAFGFYRVWQEARSVPIERLRQLWKEEHQLYGPLPEGLRRVEDLDEAWQQQVLRQEGEQFPLLARLFSRRAFAQWLARELKRARVDWDVSTGIAILLLLLVASFSFVAIGLSVLAPTLSSWAQFLLAFVIALLAPLSFLGWLRQRQRRFLRQVERVLPDTLGLMANALRAGMGFQQALELAAQEGLPPLREEFGVVHRAVALGASLEEALKGLLERVPSTELMLVVTAVLVQQEVGGSLARLLETAAETVRNRLRLRQEIRAETSLARLSAVALAFGLPAFVFLLANYATIATGSEPWSAPMFTDPFGQKALVLIIVLEVIGWTWLQRIVDNIGE